jgi:phosphoribosylanthranilate isomerase
VRGVDKLRGHRQLQRMPNGVRIKVCGLTSIDDALHADRCGADHLGFIFHPASPRNLAFEDFKAMRGRIPQRKTVAVVVEPDLTLLGKVIASGAHLVQAHFRLERWEELVPMLIENIGVERLWLAPRTPEPAQLPEALLKLGKFFLVDAFSQDKFGGTGHTSDWQGFRTLRERWHGRCFILSGGLNAENVGDAIAATDARWLDVNSGVERSPGVKDSAKVEAFFAAVARRTELGKQ